MKQTKPQVKKKSSGQNKSKETVAVKKNTQVWFILLTLIAAALVFSPGLKNQFLNWDDAVYVTENPTLSLTSDHVAQSFTRGETHGMYVPLTALSLSLNNYFSGLNPRPYLWTNLILHLINILLVFLLLRRLFPQPLIVFAGTLLFALHPMQAESVSYVSGRRDLLYGLFFLASLIFYSDWLKSRRRAAYAASLLFFILSLFSKGQALVLPFVLMGIDFLSDRKGIFKKALMEKLPFFVFSLIFILITFAVRQASPDFRIQDEVMAVPLWQRMVYACYGFIMYMVNLIIPFRLSLIHPYPLAEAIPAGFWIFPPLVLACVAWGFYLLKKNRGAAFGLLFFAVTLVMVLQIIPNSYGIMNDHYIYIPCIGLFVLITSLLQRQMSKKSVKNLVIAGGAVYLLALGTFTYSRTKVFHDDISVFTDVLEKYPDSYLAYNNRATAKMKTGDVRGAFQDFNQALKCYPRSANVYANRAALYISSGNFAAALKDLNEAIRIKPDFANAYGNRGIARSALQDTMAIEDFNKALQLHPNDPKLYYNRGAYWLSRGQRDLACPDVKKARAMGLKEGNPAVDNACR